MHILYIVWWDFQSILSLMLSVGFIFFLRELMQESAIHTFCSTFQVLLLWLVSRLVISACFSSSLGVFQHNNYILDVTQYVVPFPSLEL